MGAVACCEESRGLSRDQKNSTRPRAEGSTVSKARYDPRRHRARRLCHTNRIAYLEDIRMDEAKLRTLCNLGSAVMILALAGAFYAVIRAGLQAAAGH